MLTLWLQPPLLLLVIAGASVAFAIDVAPRNGSDSFALADRNDNFTCVGGCTCYQTDFTRSLYAVLCGGPGVRDIPAFLTEDLHQIESMTLIGTSIAQIDSLRMFSGLAYLNLNQSLVQALDSRLVTTFPALESLHLAGNRLRQLSDLNLLQHLSLRTIDFGANQLTGFDRSGSMSLRVLSLRRNLFTSLDDLGANYGALRRLDASENRLSLEGLSSWVPPPDLEVLDLSGNQLSSTGTANASFLQRLPQLQQLSLSGNRLASLGPVTNWLPAGSKLWKLSLAGNPFVCSCALYRDKERLAGQGVIVSDAPTCRLANGTEYQLTRLGSWACADVDGGGTAGPELASAGWGAVFQQPLVIGLTAALAAGLACLAVGAAVWTCRGRQRREQQQQQQQQYQHQDVELPYNNASVKSTNLTGSQASVATYRSGLPPYAFDPQRSRVFSRKLPLPNEPQFQQQQQQQLGQRSQSEQILAGTGCRGSTPLPPIPGTAAAAAAPLAQDYVDMGSSSGGGGGDGYDEIQMQQYQQQQHQQQYQQHRQPEAMQEGYIDMDANA